MKTSTNKSKPSLKVIEVFKNESSDPSKLKDKNRDQWNWHVAKRYVSKKRKPNVLYSGRGYNSKQIAWRVAEAHNLKDLKKELPMFDLSRKPIF